jgi:putative oxidoreductase
MLPNSERLPGTILSAVRIVVAFLFLCHGLATLFGVLGGAGPRGGGAVPVATWPSWWAGLIQFVGGLLVLLGLFTRPAAVVCAGTMAFAYFSVHQPLAPLPIQNYGEPAALYAWIFLLFAALGPGPYALDALRYRHREGVPAPRTAAAAGEPVTGGDQPRQPGARRLRGLAGFPGRRSR